MALLTAWDAVMSRTHAPVIFPIQNVETIIWLVIQFFIWPMRVVLFFFSFVVFCLQGVIAR